MLRKLLKYEFRATARVMLPLYLVVIVLALLTRGASLWTKQATFYGLGEGLLGVLAALIAVGFILALLATFVVAVVLAVVRFRNNLLTDEGYVMFTLPVSPHSLVCSKLIVSAVWFLGAVVIDAAALISLVAAVAMFQEMGRVIQEVFDSLTAYYLGNGVLFLVEVLILFLLGCAYTCLSFYTPLAIGHSFAQHKMLLSVAFFFAIVVAVNMISGTAMVAGLPFLDDLTLWVGANLTPAGVVHGVLWGSIAYTAVFTVVLYCITIRMLHRHLNLE